MKTELVITGIGVLSAIGQGKADFSSSLLEGKHSFGQMKRPGRQKEIAFIGAEIEELIYQDDSVKKRWRRASLTSQAALLTLMEAWQEAELDHVPAERIGLIVGGSNMQQREMFNIFETYHHKPHFISPTYGMSFMDSDVCGWCTEQFNIKGLACTIGGSSASGQLAVIQACEAVLSGQVDACIALGALMDISYMECHAFRSLGAMGTDLYAHQPEEAARPFDQNRDGFIYGENCGAVVIERKETALKRGIRPYARLLGWARAMDGNRNPNPSREGEQRVIQQALGQANLSSKSIDYINPHGTGSLIGDETELQALRDCELTHAYINATKSITGHGLSAAGVVELIATLLQMEAGQLHPTRNLQDPMDASFNWVRQEKTAVPIIHSLNLSFGFGGINTAVCLKNER
ncbi:beta-ketoacyl synthase N-terminal-like domain-containing protein [Bacillus inaquosorum]|uniref:beta-ketoacyl synthase N-terminal-like domain-containing protein n=1 Tax=Bacillus inaquosorum TaxID=483913 RepID=UPI000745CDD0|nr:beta-ketoacyl synthase N-terminal-like domain-containing protein [Bacillus inaquosorum]PPA34063.1 polyketide beta-ketoacyl:ACP synthase [Bacillus subtilis]AMA52851.1 polyketide beta-ketoacyl:ACP synthase [Bacillus inaquosorum]MBT2193481.1 polyketide beta-ketoacyl:ACP synthase [Bacillus inaquosorum]MBT3120245.1 polyketide beta-ketoacyl:ACP synthase [Bacillus inaquosorum]MBT3124566.1 polyketide beta-ketoacyl:ACP synthase [Bacillus inaquosorum]